MAIKSKFWRWVLYSALGLLSLALLLFLTLVACISFEMYSAKSEARSVIDLWKRDSKWIHFADVPPILREAILVAESPRTAPGVPPTPSSAIGFLTNRSDSRNIFQFAAKILILAENRNRRSIVWALDNLAVAAMLSSDFEGSFEIFYNRCYLGEADNREDIIGFDRASLAYFNKKPSELDWAKAALLAALPIDPSGMDPKAHPDKAKRRRDFILDKIEQTVPIEHSVIERAKAEPLLD